MLHTPTEVRKSVTAEEEELHRGTWGSHQRDFGEEPVPQQEGGRTAEGKRLVEGQAPPLDVASEPSSYQLQGEQIHPGQQLLICEFVDLFFYEKSLLFDYLKVATKTGYSG